VIAGKSARGTNYRKHLYEALLLGILVISAPHIGGDKLGY
jgi:hypothetical protein